MPDSFALATLMSAFDPRHVAIGYNRVGSAHSTGANREQR